MLSRLQCQGKLGPAAGQRSAEGGRWTVGVDVETLTQDTQIELPLKKSQADWSTTAFLDGIPTHIVWDTCGVGCAIVVREPGRHHMDIPLEPSVTTAMGARKLELDLPPLAGAHFQLDYSSMDSSFGASGGQFDRIDGPVGPRLSGELDGSGHVSVTWIEESAGDSGEGRGHIDELAWLYIARDCIELELKLIVRGAGTPDAIVVAADRNWELLPKDSDEDAPTTELLTTSEQSIRVPVPVGSDERRDVSLRFRLRNAVPPGQFRVPPISVTSTPTTSQRLAASFDAKWDCDTSGGAVVAAGSAAANDFAALWGESDREPPQIVLNPADSQPGWFFAVRPRPVESKVDQRLTVTATRDGLKLRYEGEVSPAGSDRFRYSLAVPENLLVDRVSATSDGQDATLESVRVSPNQLNLFFANVMTRPFRIVLTGVPDKCSEATPLPRVSALNTPSARQTVQIFQDQSDRVHVRNLEATGLPGTGNTEASEKQGSQLVGTYLIDPTKRQQAPQILVERVEPVEMDSAKAREPTHVEPRQPAEESLPSSVRLAETTVAVAPAGSWYAVTKFRIAPSGLTQCVLQLPESQTLEIAELDGHAALIQPIDHQRWWVQLGEPTLPQTLEIVVRGVDRIDPDTRIIGLTRPSLWNAETEMPVEVGLWTLTRPKSADMLSAAAAARVSPQEAALLELDRLTSIAESATPSAMQIPRIDAHNWFGSCIRELSAAKQLVEALHGQASSEDSTPAIVHSDDDPATLAITRCEEWIAKAEELAAEPQSGNNLLADAATISHGNLSGEALRGSESTTFVSQGNENRVQVELVPVGMTVGETRASLLGLVVSVAGIAIWIVGRKHAGSTD